MIPEILQCIDFLIMEVHVDLDTPNSNGHSALTYAAKLGLSEIVKKLIKAGADVNHQALGGATALAIAINRDDYEMVKLLKESGANDKLYVEALGRPIFAINMSEKLRELIPFWRFDN